MKRIIPLLIFLISTTLASAQLVITEISYNPPESGTDSLEYIELYNETDADIDLTNYVIRDNAPHTIAGGMVPANGYAVLAINPGAMMSVLGVSAIQIADIALSNSGEGIALDDPNGTTLDEVPYDDNPPWPTFEDGTDGGGATIELCDVSSDNSEGSNWRAATNDLGVQVNEISFLGTPGAANTAICENIVMVSSNVFTPADITIDIDESVIWMNTGGFHNVNGSLDAYPDNPEGFTNGGASGDLWTYEHTFTIAGVYNYHCDPHLGLGMVGTVTVVEEVEPMIPTYDIGVVNTIDAQGLPDSFDLVCSVIGIVHGANLNPSGLQFALIDESGDGIGVFNGTNLGYTYAEGDEIKVTGRIDHFNGLLQLDEISAVELISSGNDLIGPIVVTELNEDTESRLVTLEGLVMVDVDAWDGDGSSFNIEYMDSDGDVFTLRIDGDTEVASWSEGPDVNAAYSITGIGGQFDGDAPHDSGYQIFPRYISDFDLFTSTSNELEATVTLYPNPAPNYINIISDLTLDNYILYNQTGEVVRKGTFRPSIDLVNLPSGIYSIVLSKGDKKKTVQFVK